jgi:hypothetical protein
LPSASLAAHPRARLAWGIWAPGAARYLAGFFQRIWRDAFLLLLAWLAASFACALATPETYARQLR